MCKFKITTFLFCLFNLYFYNVYSQKLTFKRAIKNFYIGNYEKALNKFQIVLSYDSSNCNVIYYIGLCYLNLPDSFHKAFNYLKVASECFVLKANTFSFTEKFAPFDVFYYLAYYYHKSYYLDSALKYINFFIENINENHLLYNKAVYLKRIINNALQELNDTSEIYIEEVSKVINTKEDEIYPVISEDETLLIFARQKNYLKKSKKPPIIMYSEKIGQKWSDSKPLLLGGKKFYGYPLFLTASKDELYIAVKNASNYDIYVSYLINNNWSKPKRLSINSENDENSCSISSDKGVIIFSSDRPGGFGGKDIYLSKKLPNGEWGLPINLGKKINTPFDEDFPLLLNDNTTLFFSSNSDKSIGGFDIFVTSIIDDTIFSDVQNLAFPLNTIDDEINFKITNDEKYAYFSSNRYNPEKNFDIYKVFLNTLPERSIVIAKVNVLFKNEKNIDLTELKVKIFDKKNNLIGIYLASKRDKKYILALNRNKVYKLTLEYKNKIIGEKEIKIEPDAEKFLEFDLIFE